MAVANFVPELWSQLINSSLKKILVGRAIVNTDYAGEIRQRGDTVRITRPGAITTATYTGADISFEDPASSQLSLVIDQARAFGFQIKDIDAQQMPNAVQVQQSYAQEAAYSLNNAADAYILNRKADVPVGNVITAVKLTKTNVADTIASAAQILDEKNVPLDNRWMVLSPAIMALITKAVGFVQTSSATAEQISLQGVAAVGNFYGFRLYMSNNLAKQTISTKVHTNLLFGHTAAITFAEQIASVETGRTEKNFGSFVKGLHLYGLKTIKPEALGAIESED